MEEPHWCLNHPNICEVSAKAPIAAIGSSSKIFHILMMHYLEILVAGILQNVLELTDRNSCALKHNILIFQHLLCLYM